MPQYGLCLQVNHTGKAATSVPLSDIRDGIDLLGGAYGFRKPGAVYVPTPANGGTAILVYSGDVAVSFESGAIRKFIDGGYLTASFIIGSVLAPTIFPEVQDEGIQVDPATQTFNFTGAGVTASQTAPGVVQVNVPGGGGGDHSLLLAPSLVWTASAHTGTPNQIAGFDGAGAARYYIVGVDVGDVVGPGLGPGSSTDNALVRWDGINGTDIQDSNAILSDAGDLTLASGRSLFVDNVGESTANNGVVVNGIRNYGKLAANPGVGPAPVDGDTYYNTVLQMQMVYDSVRGKWLSLETIEFTFGRNGNTAAGSYYHTVDGWVMSAALGWYMIRSGTVVSLAWTRADADAATFDIMASGGVIGSTASAATGGRDLSLNADFTFNQVLAVMNRLAGGNTTTDVVGWIRVKWRA